MSKCQSCYFYSYEYCINYCSYFALRNYTEEHSCIGYIYDDGKLRDIAEILQNRRKEGNMNKYKVFISQPMRGLSETQILDERKHMIDIIYNKIPDAEIIDSYFEDYKPDSGNVALKYLSKSLELLADANAVIMCRGWEHNRGCRIEKLAAEEYGIVVFLYDNVKDDLVLDLS